MTAALEPSVREDLAAAGALRVHINVDDEAVAEAQLRRANGPSPIRAVVSIWTAGQYRTVTRVLRSLDPGVAGWRVDERLPIRPPVVPDGRRADALANFAFLRRPVQLRHEQWLERWIGSHTSVAIQTQATFGYVQNVVGEPVTDGVREVAGIVEELFPMSAMTDWHAHYGSQGDEDELARRMAAMARSCDRFGASRGIDVVPTSRYVFDLRR